MTKAEKQAKQVLRERYEAQGYPVSKVTRLMESGFSVSFGEEESSGKGKGPRSLTRIRCNWPKE